MLNFLPIMLLSKAQKFAYYAQYYAHDYCNYVTVYIYSFLMTRLHSYIIRLQIVLVLNFTYYVLLFIGAVLLF